jgi:hypothetical protein
MNKKSFLLIAALVLSGCVETDPVTTNNVKQLSAPEIDANSGVFAIVLISGVLTLIGEYIRRKSL